ncbi:hypothetical protein SEVIR_3G180533v4 [Setaria viridis]
MPAFPGSSFHRAQRIPSIASPFCVCVCFLSPQGDASPFSVLVVDASRFAQYFCLMILCVKILCWSWNVAGVFIYSYAAANRFSYQSGRKPGHGFSVNSVTVTARTLSSTLAITPIPRTLLRIYAVVTEHGTGPSSLAH